MGAPQLNSWCKLLWNKCIPPSTCILLWRLQHDKFPTNNMLSKRGLHMTSRCNLCRLNTECIDHIFFNYIFIFYLTTSLHIRFGIDWSFSLTLLQLFLWGKIYGWGLTFGWSPILFWWLGLFLSHSLFLGP